MSRETDILTDGQTGFICRDTWPRDVRDRRLQAAWSRGGAGRSAVVRDGHTVAMPQGFPYPRTYPCAPKLSSHLNA